jgi:hypothetical protein
VDWLQIDWICPFTSSAAFEISRGTKKADACKASVPATSADVKCMIESRCRTVQEMAIRRRGGRRKRGDK